MHNQTQFKRVTSQLDQTSSRTSLLIGAAVGESWPFNRSCYYDINLGTILTAEGGGGEGCGTFKINQNLDIANGQGTSKTCSQRRGFVISRFFFIYFSITKQNYRISLVISGTSLHRGPLH